MRRLTDGGLETTLVFERGVDLPLFAAFPLVEQPEGRALLADYWSPYLVLARERGVGFDVDTATWRANPDWARQLGYDARELRAVTRRAVDLAHTLAARVPDGRVNGVVGPRGDGYVVDAAMSAEQAADYHRPQLEALADAGVDQVSAMTLGHVGEAVGVAWAADAAGVPAVISFTVETDGRLPDGTTLRTAVESVEQETGTSPVGYGVNCAHPTHLAGALDDAPWRGRVTVLRANASARSHAELDAADALDPGDPDDLACRYADLLEVLPRLDLVGGCCGTGVTHVRAIATAVLGDRAGGRPARH